VKIPNPENPMDANFASPSSAPDFVNGLVFGFDVGTASNQEDW